jgi:hexokinase
MISGAYLGPLCLYCARAAAKDGLFSSSIGKQLDRVEQIDTKDINDFMYHPNSGSNPLASIVNTENEEDVVTLYYLIDRLVERAAKLTAINLSSVVLKSGQGDNPCSPVCIVAEGTTFYEMKSLKSKVEYYLKQYLENQKQKHYEIVNIENATLIGAAIAGLTN